MDIFVRLLLHMAQWARRPPSRRWLVTAAIVVAVSLSIAAIERFVGWPDALTVERLPRWPMPR